MKLRIAALAVVAFLAACSDPAARVAELEGRAEEALAEGRLGDAIVDFKSVLQLDPNHVEAHYGLARAYIGERRSREAFWELEETLRLDPDHLEAKLHFARILMTGDDEAREKALTAAEEVLEAEPSSWIAMVLKGRALQELERPLEAREAYEAAVEAAPGEETKPRFLLAHFHRSQGNLAEATALYRELTEDAPGLESFIALGDFLATQRGDDDEAEAAYRNALAAAAPEQQAAATEVLANFLFSRDRLEETETLLREAIEASPESLELTSALAQLHLARGDPAKAETTLLAAAEGAPSAPGPFVALAGIRESQGDLEGAIEAAESALMRAPADVPVRLRLAELRFEHGFREKDDEEVARGRATLDAVLIQDESQPEALMLTARLLITEKRHEEAISTLRRALDRRPDSAQAYFLLGSALFARGDRNGARSALQRSLQLDPHRVDAQRALALVHSSLDEHDLAIEVGRSALERRPDDSRLRLALAQSLVPLGRSDEALAELEAIPPSQRSSEAFFALGRLRLARGELALARGELMAAYEADPQRLEVLRALLDLDQEEGHLEESARRIAKALKERPDDPRLNQLHADLALRQGDLATAEESLERAIELDANDLVAYQNLARILAASGRADEVLSTYEFARLENRKSGPLNLVLGVLYEALGRTSDAMARYEEALSLDSSLFVAANNLAYLLAENEGDLDRALQLAQRAKAALPDQPNVADTLGWVLYRKNIPSAAVGYLKEAEQGFPEGDPQLGEVRLHLALALEANEQPDQARQAAERALSALPEDAPEPPWAAPLRELARRLAPDETARAEEG